MKIRFMGPDVPLEGYGYVIESFKKVLSNDLSPDAPIGIHHDIPIRLERIAPVSIGLTMTEGTLIPKEYAQACNKMDAILVPSAQNIQAFRDSGVTVPMAQVQWGTRLFGPKPPKTWKTYRFGHLSKLAGYKNWEAVVEAFCSEFTTDEPVELWIKGHPESLPYRFYDPRIKVSRKFMDESDLEDWYHSIDCFVFPSHGEGWGLPPMEAMSAGLPVIMTNWGALGEHCNERYNYPLRINGLIDRPDLPPYKDGQWADPDTRHLMSVMRRCADKADESDLRGQRARAWIHSTYTWDKARERLFEAIKEVLNV